MPSWRRPNGPGAAILAEGIESDHQLQLAQAMGATLAQGWYLGKPEPAPSPPPAPKHPLDLLPTEDIAEPSTPFEAVHERRVSQGTQQVLAPLSRHLEYRGLDAMDPIVLPTCFQDADRFGEPTRRRYEQLAEREVFTAVLGRNMPAEPGPGIRGAHLGPSDPISGEWAVIVVGAQFAAALLPKERPDNPGVYNFVVTHDRGAVIAAARPVIKGSLPASHNRSPSMARDAGSAARLGGLLGKEAEHALLLLRVV